MAQVAKGAGSQISLVDEAVYGVTPATPAFQLMNFESMSLGLSRGNLRDNSINTTRNRKFFAYGNQAISGDVSGNLVFGTWDKLIQSALMSGNWQAACAITGATAGVAGSGQFQIATDLSAVFFPGMTFVVHGSTGNDKVYTVQSVAFSTTTNITPVEAVADGTADGTIASFVTNGVTKKSFTSEKLITSTASNIYARHTGVMANTMKLSIAPEQLATINFGLLGAGETTATAAIAGATYSDPADIGDVPFDSYSGFIREGDTDPSGDSNIVTGCSIDLNNSMEQLYAIGSDGAIEVAEGIFSEITGQLDMYIEDLTQYNKFTNGVASSLFVQFSDPNSGTVDDDTYIFMLPKIYYSGNSMPVNGGGAIVNAMPFEAVAVGSGTDLFTMAVAKIPASDS